MTRTTSNWALVVTLGLALALSACSKTALDPTVVFEHQLIPAQPWVAAGEMVDAGKVCPSGDRQGIGFTLPDGTEVTVEEMHYMIMAAYEADPTNWEVPRIGWTEYVCYDGSGAFTITEDFTESLDPPPSAVMRGTGAYADMTGTCRIEFVEGEKPEDEELATICEFEFPPAD